MAKDFKRQFLGTWTDNSGRKLRIFENPKPFTKEECYYRYAVGIDYKDKNQTEHSLEAPRCYSPALNPMPARLEKGVMHVELGEPHVSAFMCLYPEADHQLTPELNVGLTVDDNGFDECVPWLLPLSNYKRLE